MIWHRVSDYAVRSEDGRFSICRCNVAGRIDYTLYRISGQQFLSARRGVKDNAPSHLVAINELKQEADAYE